ncbi:hypothetical protein ACHAWF_015856, partial [Thalassiosira exigua]
QKLSDRIQRDFRLSLSRWSKPGEVLLVGACAFATITSFEPVFPSYEDGQQPQLSGRRVLNAAEQSPMSRKLFAAQGAGPELTGLDGQAYKLGAIPDQGVTWYKMLASPKVQWNMAPYHWGDCPQEESVFVGNTGFTFHDVDPQDPSNAKSKYLRFRLERRSERECDWNSAKSCLGGGSFIMNFGKTARDMLYPGSHTLKTTSGVIRVVAYNTIRSCVIEEPKFSAAPQQLPRNAPVDYLRQSLSSTMDPEKCASWIKENEKDIDLFTFNSDIATVHVDTPWMQILIQVRQNKVATKTKCNYGSLNVWVTDVSPEILETYYYGIFGEMNMLTSANRALRAMEMPVDGHAPKKSVDGKAHVVDGPFGA